MPVGFRVRRFPRQTQDELLRRLERLEVANIADAMHGLGLMDAALAPLQSPVSFAGSALTVTLSPGDGFMLRHAIEIAQAGDVIVVNSFGDVSRAVIGGNVAMVMKRRGVAGLVIDGALRDAAEIREIGLPTFARGITSRSGTTMAGSGEVNFPTSCGSVVVMPGDLIRASEEGVIVVPCADALSVVELAGAIQDRKGDGTNVLERARASGTSVKAFATFKDAYEERGGEYVD